MDTIEDVQLHKELENQSRQDKNNNNDYKNFLNNLENETKSKVEWEVLQEMGIPLTATKKINFSKLYGYAKVKKWFEYCVIELSKAEIASVFKLKKETYNSAVVKKNGFTQIDNPCNCKETYNFKKEYSTIFRDKIRAIKPECTICMQTQVATYKKVIIYAACTNMTFNYAEIFFEKCRSFKITFDKTKGTLENGGIELSVETSLNAFSHTNYKCDPVRNLEAERMKERMKNIVPSKAYDQDFQKLDFENVEKTKYLGNCISITSYERYRSLALKSSETDPDMFHDLDNKSRQQKPDDIYIRNLGIEPF